MNATLTYRYAAVAAVLVLNLIAVRSADAQAKGDLWEVTTQMSMTMAGTPMAMPAQTQKICAAKVWTAPPGGSNDQMKCRNSNFSMTGQTAKWTSTCAGPPAMTGAGEIVRQSADAYAGTIKYASTEGAMNIAISGKRVGGCDNPQ